MSKKQDVKKVADLACLEINEADKETFENHFEQILKYFDNLSQLNTDNVEPMVTPHNISVELRKDDVSRDLSVEEILENAPDVKDSLFKVPPVV